MKERLQCGRNASLPLDGVLQTLGRRIRGLTFAAHQESDRTRGLRRGLAAVSMRYRLLGKTGLGASELCLGALDIELSEDDLTALEEASRIEPGFPNDFGGARLAYGETFELIDDHRGLVDPLV